MMALNMIRMEQLGLKRMLENKFYGEGLFETDMAKKLRKLTFDYLRGRLTRDGIEDGPAVIEVRTNLIESGTLETFLRKQSPNMAWATDVELTLLAELIGVNLAVTMTGGRKEPTILSKDPSEDKPTVTLCNEDNKHWSAMVKGVKIITRADGNCGYNAFALSLASLARSSAVDSEVFSTARLFKRKGSQLTGAHRALRSAPGDEDVDMDSPPTPK